MGIKKINFKQKKFIYPLIALPFILLFAYVISQFTKGEEVKKVKEEISTGLGETKDSILAKDDAYNAFFKSTDKRTMLDGLDSENDSLMSYNDLLTIEQKRKIDSINFENKKNFQAENQEKEKNYYNPKNKDDEDYKRSYDIIKMLNEQAYGNNNSSNVNTNKEKEPEEDYDPIKVMKKQMLMMDSIEKARNPEYQKELLAEEKLKLNKKKMEEFMNSTINVSKASQNKNFNAIYKEEENSFIKAVIDEDKKGYLGSRIRIRLLEDIYVGKKKINKGEILYSQISGFQMQRVHLSIVSVLANGEILPINLSIYDVDGMKGLYVPESAFRDMVNEFGSQSVQGTTIDMSGSDFFTSVASKLFTSTSRSIANLIKVNKAKLKYNSYIYLINEEELKKANKN